MSQIHPQEQISTFNRRGLNFSDNKHDLHLQAFFQWLPEEFHETLLIDWAQLPSNIIGYLVNTVGDSPFAVPLAIAAFAGLEPQKARGLYHRLSGMNRLLREMQACCGVQNVAGLTNSTWKTFMAGKEVTPKYYTYFKAYAACTEDHIPAYLEKLNPQQYARVLPYVLPRLPRMFLQKYLPSTVMSEGERQRRKGKSDILVPLHTLLVALVRFRKQNTQRLLSAYRGALAHVQTSDGDLPLPFSYEDELVTVNRDAQTVADVHLEKRSVTLRFLLWDQRSWVKEHPNDYNRGTRSYAKNGRDHFAKQKFFVECLNPAEELLWFGDLIKYRIFHEQHSVNESPEDAKRRQQILTQLGAVKGLSREHSGVLKPGQDLNQFLSFAISRTNALAFDAETLCRGALFGSALATIALTNGSRMCELLQVSADRFKTRPYVVKHDGQSAGEERVMRLQLLLPKGKSTEGERKLFPISDWAWELLYEIAEVLRQAHEGRIPVVRPHRDNTKSEELFPERYLFQWKASTDGVSTAFGPEDATSLLRFILYGLEFRTKEGEPFSVSAHLLRHVMATAARHEHAVPVEAVARVLHHEQRTGRIPVSTAYYSEETEDRALMAFASFQMDLEVRAASLLMEWPSDREIAGMDEDLRESFEHWHTLLETAFGYCGNIDLCPRGYNRTLCIGCPHLNVDPRKRKNAEQWLGVYTRFAEELESAGNEVDARQYRLLVYDLEKHLKDMEFLQAAIDDGTSRPIFFLRPANSCEGIIVDAEA